MVQVGYIPASSPIDSPQAPSSASALGMEFLVVICLLAAALRCCCQPKSWEKRWWEVVEGVGRRSSDRRVGNGESTAVAVASKECKWNV